MSGLQWVGVGIVGIMAIALFAGTAYPEGWLVATVIWAIAIAMTAVIVVGIGLATGAIA